MIPERYEEKNSKEKICHNCLTKVTPLWRRSKKGANLCNACGLYYRNHGDHRPYNKTIAYQSCRSLDQFRSNLVFLEKIAIAALAELKSRAKMAQYFESDEDRCSSDYFKYFRGYRGDISHTDRLAQMRKKHPYGSQLNPPNPVVYRPGEHPDPRTFRIPERTGRKISELYPSQRDSLPNPEHAKNRFVHHFDNHGTPNAVRMDKERSFNREMEPKAIKPEESDEFRRRPMSEKRKEYSEGESGEWDAETAIEKLATLSEQ